MTPIGREASWASGVACADRVTLVEKGRRGSCGAAAAAAVGVVVVFFESADEEEEEEEEGFCGVVMSPASEKLSVDEEPGSSTVSRSAVDLLVLVPSALRRFLTDDIVRSPNENEKTTNKKKPAPELNASVRSRRFNPTCLSQQNEIRKRTWDR